MQTQVQPDATLPPRREGRLKPLDVLFDADNYTVIRSAGFLTVRDCVTVENVQRILEHQAAQAACG